ncbi:MAG: hypothetical protein V3T17_11905 [Pseudomonadales bacterium]
MKINSVKLMREIRKKLDKQINGMTWEEENEYLKEKITTFDFLLINDQLPNKAIQSDSLDARR